MQMLPDRTLNLKCIVLDALGWYLQNKLQTSYDHFLLGVPYWISGLDILSETSVVNAPPP
jgi:hypothetical protein